MMELKKDSRKGKTAIGLMIVAAIGVGLGILLAPDKGKKTRKKIKGKVADAGHDVSEWLTTAKNDLAKTASEKKQAFDKKLDDSVSSLSAEAQEIIASLDSKLKEVKKKSAKLKGK